MVLASFAVPGPRSLSYTIPSWVTAKVITPEDLYSAGYATKLGGATSTCLGTVSFPSCGICGHWILRDCSFRSSALSGLGACTSKGRSLRTTYEPLITEFGGTSLLQVDLQIRNSQNKALLAVWMSCAGVRACRSVQSTRPLSACWTFLVAVL
jgi:hypothetical protein